MCCCREAVCVSGGAGGDSPHATSVSNSKHPKGGTSTGPVPASVCPDGLCVTLAHGDSALMWFSRHIMVPVPPR